MNEDTILLVSGTILDYVDFSKCKKETLSEIEFSINEINSILENEKVRKILVKNELKIDKDKKDLLNYLVSIEKNIKKLTLYLDILENKKKILLFNIKEYLKSLENVNLEETISIK